MPFNLGIEDFFVRRQNFFQNINLDGTFQERIRQLKERMSTRTENKPLVVISGAGPAGLLRAIQSISNGNPTKVIERRSEEAPGRANTVALTETTIAMLKYCGIYSYLLENRLIYPPNRQGYISVRLKDLEKAMKTVLQELSPDSIIEYNSKIVAIDTQEDKIRLTTESSTGERSTISDVGIFVNAEGSRSSTNALLGIERIEVLPAIPVIAAMCRDDRPYITNVGSFFVYVGKSITQIAITVYYHTIFFFQFLFSKNFRAQITGALILPTPGQNYVGCGFSDTINDGFKALKESGNEQEYLAFAKHWINLAICAANMVSFLSWFKGDSYLHTGRHLPLDQFEIVHIGADHANKYVQKSNNSTILLAGDASATVDPTTGLGCNTAIQSSVDFLDFLWDYDNNSKDKILQDYKNRTSARIKDIHNASIFMRSLYRPDALIPMSMFGANLTRLDSHRSGQKDTLDGQITLT